MKGNFGTAFLNISVFGSASREDQDNFSDLDILAVVKDGHGKQDDGYVLDVVGHDWKKTPSVSWYGERKIRNFFDSGDLFAWHLYLEAKPLALFPPLVDLFGKPKPYNDAHTTICELKSLFFEAYNALTISPQNEKYELGIAYVCFRNIAMSASWHLCPKPDFGRYSPYAPGLPSFPIARCAYDILWHCRVSGQRGYSPPDTQIIETERLFLDGGNWIRRIEEEIQRV